MAKKTFIVSDSHFYLDNKPDNSRRLKVFIDFLKENAGEMNQLFLLGDIFDFWFEWNHVIPKYNFELLYFLKKMTSEMGIKITYITGNHDFYLGSFFEKNLGIDCVDHDFELLIGDKKHLLTHGDGKIDNDKGYRILRKILRSKISNFLFKNFIHPDMGVMIAKFTSGSSRKYNGRLKSSIDESYMDYCKSKIDEGYDGVIIGHIHCPQKYTYNDSTIVNSGDWINYYSFVIIDSEEISLNYYKHSLIDDIKREKILSELISNQER
ncbi:MAG: UDP-2,3-diacylglucosamine diphosphatase [Candidatus Delongbacteria bacterium]|nr:UDP-2,3-diacylglucosamine diphosphatase [Candidatus Delongbacteria bacterium]MBN2835239.1 UDP-2,3-diacylglucosamine diphosphatase [Candidatus Delongbacteria bacterium]